MNTKDTIYSEPGKVSSFKFDAKVAEVFPDMIQRSVPAYQDILTGISELTALYAQPNSKLYDLGCSLGAVCLSMRRSIENLSCEIIAVDNSQAMLERAENYISAFSSNTKVNYQLADICDVEISQASVVVLNFTLQFIAPDKRLDLLKKIHAGMKPGGLLIISEKIHFPDTKTQNTIEHLHLQFKRNNGYSELEISQKRSSLDNVLISDTREEHLERFAQAGFATANCWYQAYNFASFFAVKS